MFDGSDQLPLGPHANRVLVHRLVDDRERHKRGQFEILDDAVTPFVVLQRRISSVTGANDTVHTTTVSVSTRSPRAKLKLPGLIVFFFDKVRLTQHHV
jgi:hypothetical protein